VNNLKKKLEIDELEEIEIAETPKQLYEVIFPAIVRVAPSQPAPQIGKLQMGEIVEMESEYNGYVEFLYRGKLGYVHVSYLKVE
jgi:hypothetical protein